MADFTIFKRGSTFIADPVPWTAGTSGLANLIGCTVTSSILDQNHKRHELTVTNPSGDGINFVMINTDTAEWGVGPAFWDIKVSFGTTVVYTTTWPFNIIPQVTL